MPLGLEAGQKLMVGLVLSVLFSTGEVARASEAGSAPSKPAATADQLAAAREFFERGKTLFEQGQYDAAWLEFSSAYQLAELPDLLYNMARAEERMNRPADAAKHYREFLTKSPEDPDAMKIRDNIARLEKQAALTQALLPSQDRPRRFPIYSAIAGGGTLLFAIIGGAALGTANAKYNGLASTCAPNCSMTEALSLKPTYQTGQAFLTLAAIGAAGTAGLLVWELRRARSERSLLLLPDKLPQPAYGSY